MPAATDPSPTPSPTPGKKEAEEYEEVTETRIVGITDRGVIRKRSFKRKVRKEDILSRSYGHNQEAYEKIRKQVLGSKMATENVSALSQRFKMIQLMHGDCMDLIQSWKETRANRIKRERGNDRHAMIFVVGVALCLVLFVYRWIIL